jgi:hypothetical protein
MKDKLTVHHFLYPILAIVLIVAGVSWLKAHDAWRDAASFQRGKDDQIKMAQAAGTAAEKHSDVVAKQETKDVAAIQKQAAKPLSQSDVIDLINAVLPNAHASEGVTPEGKPAVVLPDAPEARVEIQAYKAGCDICAVRLKARDEQFTDQQTQLKAKDDELTATRLERDKWKVAAGHHGFWGNVKEWGIRIGFAAGGYAAGKVMK